MQQEEAGMGDGVPRKGSSSFFCFFFGGEWANGVVFFFFAREVRSSGNALGFFCFSFFFPKKGRWGCKK